MAIYAQLGCTTDNLHMKHNLMKTEHGSEESFGKTNKKVCIISHIE